MVSPAGDHIVSNGHLRETTHRLTGRILNPAANVSAILHRPHPPHVPSVARSWCARATGAGPATSRLVPARGRRGDSRRGHSRTGHRIRATRARPSSRTSSSPRSASKSEQIPVRGGNRPADPACESARDSDPAPSSMASATNQRFARCWTRTTRDLESGRDSRGPSSPAGMGTRSCVRGHAADLDLPRDGPACRRQIPSGAGIRRPRRASVRVPRGSPRACRR